MCCDLRIFTSVQLQSSSVILAATGHPSEKTFFFFWLHCMACGILIPWPGIAPGPWQWKQWILTTGLPGSSQDWLSCVYHCKNSEFYLLFPFYFFLAFVSFFLSQIVPWNPSFESLLLEYCIYPIVSLNEDSQNIASPLACSFFCLQKLWHILVTVKIYGKSNIYVLIHKHVFMVIYLCPYVNFFTLIPHFLWSKIPTRFWE